MAAEVVRHIFFYRRYFLNFYATLQPAVQRKFDWTLQLIATVDRVPVKFFKHLEGTDGLYEIRVEVGPNIYRTFSFFDKGQLIVLLNGFQKKSQKTPKSELEQALQLKKQYFDEQAPTARK